MLRVAEEPTESIIGENKGEKCDLEINSDEGRGGEIFSLENAVEYFHVRFLVGRNGQRRADSRTLRGGNGTKRGNKHVRDKFGRKWGNEIIFFSKRGGSCLIKIAGGKDVGRAKEKEKQA